MKVQLTLIVLLFAGINVLGQNNFSSNYDRSSITTIYLNNKTDKYDSKLRLAANNASVFNKFDDHNLETRNIDREGFNTVMQVNVSGTTESFNDKVVKRNLENNKIPNLMILKWWDVDEQGNYSTKVIEERGIYNATDVDFSVAETTKRGISMLKDSGEKLIGNSYILAVDFLEILTMKQIYDAQDAAARKSASQNDTQFIPVKQTKTGYQGDALVRIYKINWNDTLNSEIWTSPYYDSEKNKFNIDEILNKQLSLSFLARFKVDADGSQYKDPSKNPTNTLLSDDQLFVQMYNAAVTNTLINAPKKLEAFRVKTGLISRKPLAAKIGKKEGLSVDQRYFVWENKMNRKGDILKKRKGVIRVKKVTDNRQTQLGETPTSRFYQTAGRRLNEGMLLQQNPDLGIGISFGKMTGPIAGFNLRAELNASLYGGYASSDMPAGIRLYGFVGFETANYPSALNYDYIGESDITFTRFGAGLAKEMPFARNFKFIPFVGFGKESTSTTALDDLEYIDTYLLDYGVRFGLNIRYNMQVLYSLNYIMPLGYASAKFEDEEDPELLFESWTDLFEGRSGLSNEISIRFLF